MNFYRYQAYTQSGKVEKGYFPADSEQEVINFLTRSNLIPVKINKVKDYFWNRILLQRFLQRIKLSEKIYLFKNLYLILKSGLDLNVGLQVLISETKGNLKNFLLYFKYTLERGESFYRAFMAFSQAFSIVEVEIIRAGELSGNLQNNLLRLSKNLEQSREVRREIISDLMYPVLVLFLSFGVLVFLMLFVLPRISQLLEQIVENPPFLTRVILSISSFFRENLLLIIYTILAIAVSMILFVISKKGRQILKKISIRLPLIKTLFLYLDLSNALFILRSLIDSGIHLTEAFRLSSQAISHPELKSSFVKVERYIKSGLTVDQALKKEKAIPSLLSSILGVASESGSFIDVLETMEEYYREEAKLRMKNLLNLLEPFLVIFLGIVVGLVAVAVIIPIYQQISSQLEFQPGGGGGLF